MSSENSPLPRDLVGAVGVVAFGLALTACGASTQQTVLPPQTMTSPAAAQQAPPPALTEPDTPDLVQIERGGSAQDPQEEARDETTIVVSGSLDATPDDGRSALLRASERERARRSTSQAPVAVINDGNLSEMAEGARVTIGGAPAVDPEVEQAIELSEEMKEQEVYWRTRAREVRQEWRDAHDSISELEAQAEDLRTRFYAEDDPVRRDREIKPAWDRTLDRLDEARRGVERAQERLAQLQDEGRRAGALPGWLREGAELVPPPSESEELQEADPAEPKIIKN